MCKDEAPSSEPKLARVSDVVQTDPKLAGCKSVGELQKHKPDTGAVLLGGHALGPLHSLEPKGLLVVVNSKFIAKVSFVDSCRDSGWTDVIELPQSAKLTGDLKRTFYERFKARGVDAALAASGLPSAANSSASEQDLLASIVCRDGDGSILADTDTLPAPSSISCAIFGYHAEFFLDIKPASMRQIIVEDRINVSQAAIDEFVKTPDMLGAWAHQLKEYPSSYATMRGELDERLRAAMENVPAALTPDRLEEAGAAFRNIEKGAAEDCRSNLPVALARYAEEVAEKIKTHEFDSLEPSLTDNTASHLLAMAPFVKELARIQSSSEWVNYNTETNHPDDLDMAQIVSEIQDRESSLKLHVSIDLH